MTDTAVAPHDATPLATLLSYLAADPANPHLLLDAADAALDAGQPDQARVLLDRLGADTAATPRARHLGGVAALQCGRFADAATAFAALLGDGQDDPAIRFNAAWAHTRAGDTPAARAVLDDATARALPQAAALRVSLLHDAGELEQAFTDGQAYLARHPDNRALAAAMSTLAIDMGDEALAAACAAQAPDHPDALATLGTLALGNDDAAGATTFFDQVIARTPNVPRAWVGRGLAALMTGDKAQAPADIDRGAALFGDHLGSWIAAGWAHFVAGDHATSRARFAHALALDHNFAETHGALAVLDVLAGDTAAARERVAVALRLDRECFSAALAAALLASGGGDPEAARTIVDRALNTPIDGSTRTIAQSLVKLGMDLP